MINSVIKLCSRSLKLKTLRVRNFSILKDITGSPVRSAYSSILEPLDDCIANILSSNNDSRERLTEILTIDSNFHFAKILHTFEDVRYQLQPNSAVDYTILEALLCEGLNALLLQAQ